MVVIFCLLSFPASDYTRISSFFTGKQMKTRNTGILEGWNNRLKQKNKTKKPFFFSTFSFFLFFPSIPLFQALLFSQHSNIPSFHHSNVISLPSIPVFQHSVIPVFHYLTFWIYPQENVEKLWNWIPYARRSAESTSLPNK